MAIVTLSKKLKAPQEPEPVQPSPVPSRLDQARAEETQTERVAGTAQTEYAVILDAMRAAEFQAKISAQATVPPDLDHMKAAHGETQHLLTERARLMLTHDDARKLLEKSQQRMAVARAERARLEERAAWLRGQLRVGLTRQAQRRARLDELERDADGARRTLREAAQTLGMLADELAELTGERSVDA